MHRSQWSPRFETGDWCKEFYEVSSVQQWRRSVSDWTVRMSLRSTGYSYMDCTSRKLSTKSISVLSYSLCSLLSLSKCSKQSCECWCQSGRENSVINSLESDFVTMCREWHGNIDNVRKIATSVFRWFEKELKDTMRWKKMVRMVSFCSSNTSLSPKLQHFVVRFVYHDRAFILIASF